MNFIVVDCGGTDDSDFRIVPDKDLYTMQIQQSK